MRVAVTGASGHIGSALCRVLYKNGYYTKALIHKKLPACDETNFEPVQGNIMDRSSLDRLVKGADVVFHLAAALSIGEKSNKILHDTNVTGTANIIDACKMNDVKRLVHFSTIHTLTIPNHQNVLDESSPMASQYARGYEASKTEAEKLVIRAGEDGLDVVILNPTAVIGPYDHEPSYLGRALISLFRNRMAFLVNGGYDFVDVRDVADAAVNSIKMGRPGNRYILSGTWMSLSGLSEMIGRITGKSGKRVPVPDFVARATLPFVRVWAKLVGRPPLYTREALEILRLPARNISNAKARAELGFDPRPLSETLAETYNWFDAHKYL